MNKFSEFICKHKKIILELSLVLLILSFIGMKLTRVNYDILVYLPQDIETIKGQNVLTEDFAMGSYSIAVAENLTSKDLLSLEERIKEVEGVNEVASLYDVIGTSIPLEMLPSEVVDKVHQDNTDILFITFSGSTSSDETLNAVSEIREISSNLKQGGMSSMVLDTMDLSEKEIFVYVVIAVILCILILEVTLDSYVVPILLLANIGFAIVFNLGSNIVFGEISYITKALVAVLQLGVTTDFSIFLYHSYEKKKQEEKTKEEAMKKAIKETFTSVTGSSLTTIAGFLVLCTMQLTLGKDLGIVMAKGVLLGVICVLTLFPSLLLLFDNLIEKTRHKQLSLNFTGLNKFIIKHKLLFFIAFILLFVPVYLGYSKVDVYYKLDKSLPDTLESISTNEFLKEEYNIVSPEIILVNRDLKNDDVINLTEDLENTPGISFALSLAKLKELGVPEDIIPEDFLKLIQNKDYQMILLNSEYETATNELNSQIDVINDIVKKYDKSAIVAGEGPLMKDLVSICDIDFKNVNNSSIICIFIILFFVLKSVSLPFLLIMAIEFAIFMNMSFSYFGGVTLPFIAPIVLGTIQLGATIDYAILLTTTYLNKRKNNMPKDEAMLETLNYTGTSILTSGMCFFAATFGVGVYSKIEMIGTLCSLIAQGAIISMLAVIMILPSILLIFDKLIMKTTLNVRGENNMKKNMKKVAVLAMSTCILVSPISAFALTKNETVYGKLNQDGKVKSVLVSEQIINNKNLDKVEDYSSLEDILNVSNDKSYTKDGNKLIWNAEGKDIFYQGSTKEKLPVSVNISYKLDGKSVTLDEILGKKGKVEITLKYKNLDSHKVTINGKKTTLYTPFVVTVGTIISGENNKNIEVTNGKVVSNGTKNVVVSLATPGLYDSLKIKELKDMDTVTISYETTDFSLASIYSVITPKLVDNSDLEVFSKLDNIYTQVDSLQDNMNKIDSGAKEVAKGSNTLKMALSTSIAKLKSDKTEALSQAQISLIQKGVVAKTESQLTEEYLNGISNTAWEQVKKDMPTSDATITGYGNTAAANILTAYLGKENYNNFLKCSKKDKKDMQSCGILVKNGYNLEQLSALAQSLSKELKDLAKNTTLYVAENTTKSVAPEVASKTAITTASEVSESLSKEVANQVKDSSIKTITESLSTLYGGVDQLDKGISELATGISTFNTQGINKVTNLINTNVKGTAKKIEKLTDLSSQYDSFATSANLKNSETKFILVVDGKKAESEKKETVKEESKPTFFERIKNLFK